jgi:hypothetical protein
MAGHQLLVFVIRRDGEPGLYLDDGVTNDQAVQLLEMMASELRRRPLGDGLQLAADPPVVPVRRPPHADADAGGD